ncbi:hypothetical protein, partial [Microcoleus sp. B9-D4]|uniref:hypothetical protein n=1 Tax=Microcoleus sp. B9-D4 TaxID=2818711 RepID=UPI002FD70E99
MSRVSRKSSLSPRATGESAIDLGKDSGVDMGRKAQVSATAGGVDMGRKAQVSATAGGIGVTQEITSIGGMTVSGGVSVDVSPLRLNISGEPNYEDPSKSAISISGNAELPGGILGVSGGATINTSTGEIIGGSIGGEIGGSGINLSSNNGDIGIELTLQIPFTPIEFSLGLGFPKRKEEPTTPTPTPINQTMPSGWEPSISPSPNFVIEPGLYYLQTTTISADGTYRYDDGDGTTYYHVTPPQTGQLRPPRVSPPTEPDFCTAITKANIDASTTFSGRIVYAPQGADWRYVNAQKITRIEVYSRGQNIAPFGGVNYTREIYYRRPITISNASIPDLIGGEYFVKTTQAPYIYRFPNGAEGYTWKFKEYQLISKVEVKLIKCGESPFSLPIPTPFPNPPPRKRNMDECCRDSLKLL